MDKPCLNNGQLRLSPALAGVLKRLIMAATLDPEFCNLLLNDPEAAITAGYGEDTFPLTRTERMIALRIVRQSDSPSDLARRVHGLETRSRGSNGDLEISQAGNCPMTVKLTRQLQAVHTVLTRRARPQSRDEVFLLTADALRHAFGETRFLFRLAPFGPEVEPLSHIPCPARQMTPGVFVYDPTGGSAPFSLETEHPHPALLKTGSRHFGFMVVEILESPPDDLEHHLIALLASQTASHLERLLNGGDENDLTGLPHLPLDPATNQVWINNTPLRLKGKELAVLQLLYEHQSQVCSRELLYRMVYAGEAIPDTGQSHRLEQVIYRLKNKLNKIEGNSVRIETIYGQGYLLRLSNRA